MGPHERRTDLNMEDQHGSDEGAAEETDLPPEPDVEPYDDESGDGGAESHDG